MTLIEDLFIGTDTRSSAVPVDWDPLVESDALQEVGLLDCRVCPLTGRAGLLLDMRSALQYRTGNAGLLVVRGLQSFQWSEEPLERDLLNFAIMSSTPSRTKRIWRLECSLFPDGELAIEGKAADFHLLDAPGVPDAPPNYTDRRLAQVREGLPWWSSACTVLQESTTSGNY
ncbi:hypothetical protein ACFYVL_00465 [Streptomyces sp. NPDC004111]|uniref:hypothetical protein n=1 Tax=Streptomyces sp. NPDC004111 TaxID=3364690 RepID=UPI00368DF197